MRKRLVGTAIGRFLEGGRGLVAIKSIPQANPEKASLIANDAIADRLIRRLPKTSFLDIGAHIGSIFSAVHHANGDIECAAVEADPDKAAWLTRAFPYCRIECCAVGDAEGPVTFHRAEKSGYNSLAKIDGASGTIQVQMKRLDDIFPSETFDTVKIDIEGAELGALRGGENLIDRSRPVIMFESTGTRKNSLGYSPEMLFDWLDGKRFLIFTPDRLAHDAPPLSRDAFLDAHHYPRRTCNFFAVPSARRAEVRDAARAVLGVTPARN